MGNRIVIDEGLAPNGADVVLRVRFVPDAPGNAAKGGG